MKTLLVPVPTVGADTVLKSALSVAHLLDAHIECLYVRSSALRLAVGAVPHGETGRGAGEAMVERWERLKKESAATATKANRSFTAFCRRNGVLIVSTPGTTATPTAEWSEAEGDQLEAIIGRAWFNDLLLCSRSAYGDHSSIDWIGEVLLRTGRPILLAANEMELGPIRSILIAWKPTSQAARAVTAAIPFLRKAEVVTIVTRTTDNVDHETAKRSATQLATSLAWQDVSADIRIPEGNGRTTYQTILAEATATSADLLVMGGYGHSRTRELVFGGVTRQVLAAAPLAVLLVH